MLERPLLKASLVCRIPRRQRSILRSVIKIQVQIIEEIVLVLAVEEVGQVVRLPLVVYLSCLFQLLVGLIESRIILQRNFRLRSLFILFDFLLAVVWHFKNIIIVIVLLSGSIIVELVHH